MLTARVGTATRVGSRIVPAFSLERVKTRMESSVSAESAGVDYHEKGRFLSHVILLGDSIFDNASYVPGGPSVIEQLREALPGGWQASLLAVDGSIAADVVEQLRELPSDASHLVVSTGGNNALKHIDLIRHRSAGSYAEALTRLAGICAEFRDEYRTTMKAVLSLGQKSVVCTIYDAIPGLTRAESTGLCLFNDVILREAFDAAVPVIDLRSICAEACDYSRLSPIEPSVAGGAKIARAVCCAVVDPPSSKSRSWIISGLAE